MWKDVINKVNSLKSKDSTNKTAKELFGGESINDNELLNILNLIFTQSENKIINKDLPLQINLFSENVNYFSKNNINQCPQKKDDSNNIFTKYLETTKTLIGRKKMMNILSTPINSIDILLKRQNTLKQFLSNNTSKISEILGDISNIEKNILWLWKVQSAEFDYLLNSVYFSNHYLKFINKNETLLNIVTMFKIVFAPIYVILQPIFMLIMPYLYLKFFTNVRISFGVYFRLIKFSFFNMNPLMFRQNSNRSKLSKYLSTIMSVFFYIQGLFNAIESSRFTNSIINEMHSFLSKILKFISLTNNLKSEVSKITKDINVELPNIFPNLNCDQFKQDNHIWSNKGKILKYFNEITENKDLLLEHLNFISNIDQIVSAKELIENQKYSFSKIVKSKSPIINITNMWNPLIGESESVKNSINIGSNNPNNVIVTGPNAGGKTTFIKTLCLQVLLSQTLTITSSDYLKITPFTIINSHININDTLGKDSLFESEMNRAKDYLDILSNLSKTSFAFLIMDEMFSSTNPEEGASGAYAVGEMLGSFNNSINLITTHYRYLTKLENTKLFKNYKIMVDKDKDMNISYPYKLSEGSSNQHIALELLSKKGFDKKIIDRAIDVRKDIISSRQRIIKKKKKHVTKEVGKEQLNLKKEEKLNVEKEDQTNIKERKE